MDNFHRCKHVATKIASLFNQYRWFNGTEPGLTSDKKLGVLLYAKYKPVEIIPMFYEGFPVELIDESKITITAREI